MGGDYLLVMDCGATNLSVGAVSQDGQLHALVQVPNHLIPQPGGEEGWYVWDLDRLWESLCAASRRVCQEVRGADIRGVLVTTFGTGGAPVGEDGRILYPIISSYDTRCEELSRAFCDSVSPWAIYQTTGLSPGSWRNSNLLRLVWLREHAPEVLDRAKAWLTLPGLLNLKLTGEMSLDPTSASTFGALNLGTREWTAEALALAKVDPSLFPPLIEPGRMIGRITTQAHQESGLPEGIPVLAAGHDTQFALVGSGARAGEAVLSSGTLELLLEMEDTFAMSPERLDAGLVTQLDVRPGVWDTSLTMVGSSVLEWIRKRLYPQEDASHVYATMIREGEGAGIGSHGVTLLPSFLPDIGPARRFRTPGGLLGLSLFSDRGDIYRSALEGLSFQLRSGLSLMRGITRRPVTGLRVVGGGSRNALWNQIRADVTGLPITVNACSEATILGASMVGLVSLGYYHALEDARDVFQIEERTIEPGHAREEYDALYQRYATLPMLLKSFSASPTDPGDIEERSRRWPVY